MTEGKNRRNTIQRNLVLEAVIKLHNHPTPDEVYEYIHKEHPTISKGTVYRNLNFLIDCGQLYKVPMPDAANRVDHTLRPHYHIMCRKCGRVYDVDMPYFTKIEELVRDFHGFDIEEHQLIFTGLCPDCKEAITSSET